MKTSPFLAGVARGDISPDNPQWLTPTGMVRLLPTRGVLDPLEVQALAFETNGERACVITGDLRVIDPECARQVRQRLSQSAHCNPHRVLLGATHNHCSHPELPSDALRAQMPEPGETGDKLANEALAAWNRKVIDVMVSTCMTAFANLRPSEIASFEAPVALALGENRRMRLSSGICVNQWGAGPVVPPGQKYVGPAGGSADRIYAVSIRQIGSHTPFAVLSSYDSHIHLYELPWFSGEVAAAARRAVEARLPGLTALYASGASGDVDMHTAHPMPVGGEDESVAWFKDRAATLGDRFAGALVPAMQQPLHYLRPTTLTHTFESVGDENPQTRRIMVVATLQLGDIALVSLPGEMFIDFGHQLRQALPDKHLILISYNGSDPYYIPTALAAEQGSYELMHGPARTPEEEMIASPTGDLVPSRRPRPGIGKRIVEQLVQMIRGRSE